jgi:hypothetical protein
MDTTYTGWFQRPWFPGWILFTLQLMAEQQTGQLLAVGDSDHPAHLFSTDCLASKPSRYYQVVCNYKERGGTEAAWRSMALADSGVERCGRRVASYSGHQVAPGRLKRTCSFFVISHIQNWRHIDGNTTMMLRTGEHISPSYAMQKLQERW